MLGLNSLFTSCTDIRRIPALGTSGEVIFNGILDCVGGFCFVIESWRVTKKHLLKDEAELDLTAAASQTISKCFHNALSGNKCFILIMLSKHSKHANSEGALIRFPMQCCKTIRTVA